MGIFEDISAADLAQLPDPKPLGAKHCPMRLDRFVSKVDSALDTMRIAVKSRRLELSHGGHRLFGTYELASPQGLEQLGDDFGGIRPMLGLRGSTDSFTSNRVLEGRRVIVCSNGQWHYVHGSEVRHKNTSGADSALDFMIRECLLSYWSRFEKQLQHQVDLRSINLTDRDAHHIICESIRSGVQTGQHAAESLQQWHAPSYDWGEKTAWRLENSMSYVSERRIQNPHTRMRRTLSLSKLFDSFSPVPAGDPSLN